MTYPLGKDMVLEVLNFTQLKICTNFFSSTKPMEENGIFNGVWVTIKDGLEEFIGNL